MNSVLLLLLLSSPWLVEPGAPKIALEKAAPNVAWLDARSPQALRLGLIETRLLETLNFFEVTPKSADGAFDAAAFSSIARLETPGRKYVWVVSPEGRVTFIFFRISVPVNGEPWSRDRLAALERALDEIGSPAPVKKDPRGNVFQWKRGNLRAWYLPQHDELRVLLW